MKNDFAILLHKFFSFSVVSRRNIFFKFFLNERKESPPLYLKKMPLLILFQLNETMDTEIKCKFIQINK